MAWAGLGTAVLVGTGVDNQQVLLTVSVQQASLAVPPLLLVDLEQGCAASYAFAQEMIIELNWSCKQWDMMGTVFCLPAFTILGPVLL